MEQRQFDRVETSTETLFGARRGLDFDRAATDTDNVGRAREMLNISNPTPAIEDDRRKAMRTLFPDRAVEPDQSYFETATETERAPRREEEEPKTRLFVGGFTDFGATATDSFYEEPIYDPALAPSDKTMRYAAQAEAPSFAFGTAEAETTQTERKPMTRKAKLTVAIYAGVIAVVAALIVLTGALIGSIGADVAGMESEVVSQRLALQSVNDKLEEVTDPGYLENAALGQGMTRPNASVEIKLLPVVGSEESESRSNGFDRFCDWLSRIFG